jgi:hypothetical protein
MIVKTSKSLAFQAPKSKDRRLFDRLCFPEKFRDLVIGFRRIDLNFG